MVNNFLIAMIKILMLFSIWLIVTFKFPHFPFAGKNYDDYKSDRDRKTVLYDITLYYTDNPPIHRNQNFNEPCSESSNQKTCIIPVSTVF